MSILLFPFAFAFAFCQYECTLTKISETLPSGTRNLAHLVLEFIELEQKTRRELLESHGDKRNCHGDQVNSSFHSLRYGMVRYDNVKHEKALRLNDRISPSRCASLHNVIHYMNAKLKCLFTTR